jgi:hypothetical protein
MERWEIVKELEEWSRKSEKENLTADEYRNVTLNIYELETMLEIEDRKRNKNCGK